jgi:hypothetical protein
VASVLLLAEATLTTLGLADLVAVDATPSDLPIIVELRTIAFGEAGVLDRGLVSTGSHLLARERGPDAIEVAMDGQTRLQGGS